MLTDWRRRRATVPDAGFTLVEAVAAIAVAAIMLTAIAFAAVTGIHASTEARINQQAGDVIESAIESARAQGYDNLAMSTSDPNLTTATDSRLTSSGCPNSGTLCVSVPNPTGSGTVKENLVTTTATSAYITNHIQTDTTGTNKVPFTVSSYITTPSDEAGATYKRLTIYVSWTIYGTTHTRVASTYITNTRRGLPLPHFKLDPVTATAVTVNPGTTVTFGFKLTNLGARDSWDFTSNLETFGWTYYLDNGDGNFDPTTDTVMTDSDGDGVRDTGFIETNNYAIIWITHSVPSNAANGTTTAAFTATSVAQPNLGAGVSSLTQNTSITVTSGVISPTPTTSPSASPSSSPSSTPSSTPSATPASCTMVGTRATTGTQYYLHNTTDGTSYTGTGSTAIQTMQFSQNTPSATSLYDYSTNDGQGNFAGRYLQTTTPSFTNTNALQVANWKFQVVTNGQTKFSGTTYLDVWAEPSSGLSTDSVSLTAMVGYGASTATTGNGGGNNGNGSGNTTVTWTNEGAATTTGSNCGSWREFVIPVTTSSFSASKNDWIEVLLFNSGTTGVRVAYDTTVYSANVIWTQK